MHIEACTLIGTYLFLLFVKVIDDDSNKQVQRKEWAENYKEYEIQIHVDVSFPNRLFQYLQ